MQLWLQLLLLSSPLMQLLLWPAASADGAKLDEAASILLHGDAAASTTGLDGEWRQFRLKFAKFYSTDMEEKYRRQVWQSNHLLVQRHNRLAASGQSSFTLGMNQFADLTASEFAAIATSSLAFPSGARAHARRLQPGQLPLSIIGSRLEGDPPPHVDWRLKGCVSMVRDEGEIDSASVFAVVGSIEGQLCAGYGRQRTWLSNQQVIDCAKSVDTPASIYAYLASNQGRLDTGIPDTCYPETGRKGPCAFKANCTAAIVTGYVNISSGSESALQTAVANSGPVTVVVDASEPSFQFYHSGVYNEPNCSSSRLDHVMLTVGYGVATTGGPYWLVKNSWGQSWGEGGYILMSRNRSNQCGIATAASYATVTPPS